MRKRNYLVIAAFIILMLMLVACEGGGDTGTAVDSGTVDVNGELTGEQPLATTIVGTPQELGNETDTNTGTGGEGSDVTTQTTATAMPTEETIEVTAEITVTTDADSSNGGTATPQVLATTDNSSSADTTDSTAMNSGLNGGSIYVSDEFGFAIQLPAGWALREVSAQQPGTPEDWPVLATWMMMPPYILAQIQDQIVAQTGSGGTDAGSTGTPEAGATGTPGESAGTTQATDTLESTSTGTPQPGTGNDAAGATGLTLTPTVAPFMIEVVQGGAEALQRTYPMAEGSEPQESQFGTNTANVITFEPGYIQVFFQHPTLDDITLVITDWVTQFPGRETLAEEASVVWQPMLETLIFRDEAGMFDYSGFEFTGPYGAVFGSGDSSSTIDVGSDPSSGGGDSGSSTTTATTPEATSTP